MAITGSTSLTYNSNDLQTANIIVNSIEDAQAPERSLAMFNLVRTGGAVITDSTYFTKTIRVTGKLMSTSSSALETLIDTFHSYFSVQDKNLDIGYAGSTRRYVCTPARVTIDRPVRGANWAAWEIDFTTTEYGKATSATTMINNTTISTTPSTQTLTSIGGSAPEQMMVIQITIFSGSGYTGKTITLTNSTTGEILTVTRTWATSDVLIVDVSARTVKVNGVDVDFDGAFPNFSPGTHNLTVANNFTTYSLRCTVTHTRRYI